MGYLRSIQFFFNRLLWPIGVGKIPIANLFVYEVTPERVMFCDFHDEIKRKNLGVHSTIDFGKNGGVVMSVHIETLSVIIEYLPGSGYSVEVESAPFVLVSQSRCADFKSAKDQAMDQIKVLLDSNKKE